MSHIVKLPVMRCPHASTSLNCNIPSRSTTSDLALPHGRLRAYNDRDFSDLFALCLMPDVRKICFGGARMTEHDAVSLVDLFDHSGQRLLWAIEIQEDRFAGLAGLFAVPGSTGTVLPIIMLKPQFADEGLDECALDCLNDGARKAGLILHEISEGWFDLSALAARSHTVSDSRKIELKLCS